MERFVDWNNQVVLVTGGTCSFGKECVEIMLREYHPGKLIIYSRDDLKQHEMRTGGFNHPNLRYFIGDVRDLERLRRAMHGVDIVVHAAALKQVPACEYNPMEAIKTNILGSGNVVEAALDNEVKKVLALSTDKAVNPVNLYGATKLAAEKLFVQSNAYAGGANPRFSCVRYGNGVGSRGSAIPIFIRFAGQMVGGEVFVPKIPSTRIVDLARAIAPDSQIEIVGIRTGEKLHE